MATQSHSDDPVIPVDLGDFRRRGFAIAREREAAREARERHALAEADADHDYSLQRSLRLTELRARGQSQAEALIHAEGDTVVAEHKRRRARENALKKSAEFRIDETERNAASLRVEATMSENI